MKKKLLIIGIDSATFDLINPWIEQGKLPSFRRLSRDGISAVLYSTNPPLTPPAWTTFMTGKNPGKHGIIDFYKLNQSFQLSVTTALDRKQKSIWNYLSDHGKKCILFQVPFTYPAQKVNGLLISDFTTPGLDCSFTHPAEFQSEIMRKFPHFRLSETSKYSDRIEDKRQYVKEIMENMANQWKVSHWLMKEKPWDFFMLVVMGVDHLQHWYWKYMDPSHPEHQSNEETREFQDSILKGYKAVDHEIGRFMDECDDETTIIVLSDHGAGPYLQNVSLNNWLREKKYLSLKSSPSVLGKKLLNTFGIHPTSIANLAFRYGLSKKASQNRSKGKAGGLANKLVYSYKDIDWSKTLAYSFGYYGSLYVNSIERNPKFGVVSKGDYDRIVLSVISDLSGLKDPRTGESIVHDIHRREEVYFGEYLSAMPDIVFRMKDYGYASSSMFAFSSNAIFSPALTKKTGEHRQNGIFYAYGKAIQKNQKVSPVHLEDFAPSILSFFQIPIPSDFDGRRIEGIS